MTSPGWAPDADPFEHDDAAYLLGALGDAEHAAFEAHLSGCAACTARVAALRPAAGALAGGGEVVRDALARSLEPTMAKPSIAGTGLQADRVAWLARLVERRRRRIRWAFGGLAAVVAAALAALVVAVALPSTSPPTTVAAQQMTATGVAAIRATAAIAAEPWGSEITIDCSYIGVSQYASGHIYALEVVDRSGRSHQIGSWTLSQGTQAKFVSGTALPPGQIRAVNVIEPDGTVVLQLSL